MQDKRKTIYTCISLLVLILCIIFMFLSGKHDTPSGKVAGKVNTSDTSVSINNQLIPAYDLKSGVYIAAEDLQLYGFTITQTDVATRITPPEKSHIDREYITKLSRIEENESAFYPQKQVTIDNSQITSYQTKQYTLIPISVLRNLGDCSKEPNSTLLTCDLYN